MTVQRIPFRNRCKYCGAELAEIPLTERRLSPLARRQCSREQRADCEKRQLDSLRRKMTPKVKV